MLTLASLLVTLKVFVALGVFYLLLVRRISFRGVLVQESQVVVRDNVPVACAGSTKTCEAFI